MSIPLLFKPEYRIIFYHSGTGAILKYVFKSEKKANNFFSKLDKSTNPTMYKIERIR